jgi:hypothetical protein
MTLDDVREKNRDRQRRYRARQGISSKALQSDIEINDDFNIGEDKPKSNVTDVNNVREASCKFCNSLRLELRSNKKEIFRGRYSDLLTENYSIFTSFLTNPITIAGVLFILAITVILVVLQTIAYTNMGQSLGLPISIVCEMALVVLMVINFHGWKKICSATVTLLLFCYNLGLMSFNVIHSEGVKTATALKENYKLKNLNYDITLAQKALSLATTKQESGNIKFHSARIDRLRGRLDVLTPKFVRRQISQVRNWGMISLRAILMLLNALLAHSLADYFRDQFHAMRGRILP